jgi:hypothetical protein
MLHGRDLDPSMMTCHISNAEPDGYPLHGPGSRKREGGCNETPPKRHKLNSMGPEPLHLGGPVRTSSDNVLKVQSDIQSQHEPALAKKDIFPFMQLPPEIRLHCYRTLFLREAPIPLYIPKFEPLNDDTDINQHDWGYEILHTTDTAISSSSPLSSEANTSSIQPSISKPCLNLLLISKAIYNEARTVLYSSNEFSIDLDSGAYTLSKLHQHTRKLIRTLSIEISSQDDFLLELPPLIRLGLRYCWGLKELNVTLSESLDCLDLLYPSSMDHLGWLPKGCKICVAGSVSEGIRRLIGKEKSLVVEEDEVSYWDVMV